MRDLDARLFEEMWKQIHPLESYCVEKFTPRTKFWMRVV